MGFSENKYSDKLGTKLSPFFHKKINLLEFPGHLNQHNKGKLLGKKKEDKVFKRKITNQILKKRKPNKYLHNLLYKDMQQAEILNTNYCLLYFS